MNNSKRWRVFVIVILVAAVITIFGLAREARLVDAQTGEPACTDSDGGLNYEVAGVIEGIDPNGLFVTKYDICQSGSQEGSLQCPNGCSDGACLTEPDVTVDQHLTLFELDFSAEPIYMPLVSKGLASVVECTDLDGDSFAVEGGACGLADCDDADPAVNPDAAEVCDNGIDDNCDSLIDAADPACLVCTDEDDDGYANEGGSCGLADCDDTDPLVNPGVREICDNDIDDNCNGYTDDEDPICGAGLKNPNIIVVGWDGLQRDHFWECYNGELPECADGLPNIKALSGGVIFDNTTTNGATDTKAGWAQIFTGYNAEVTGVYSNAEYQPIPEGYSVFEKIENYFGADNFVTMFISGEGPNTGGACEGVPPLEDTGLPWCLTKVHFDYFESSQAENATIANRALELLNIHQNEKIFASFIFRDPDYTGYREGEDSVSYSEAIMDDDYWLGAIIAKLQELDIYDKTLVYVATDHGFGEGVYQHGNAPYGILASNDPLIVRSGDRKDIAPTFLQRYGIGLGAIGEAPAVDGYSLYSIPSLACIPDGEAYVDYTGAPSCCNGLTLISLDKELEGCRLATGGTGDNSGYCTACGNGVCEAPENGCNCPEDCP